MNETYFVNRERELNFFNEKYKENSSQLVIVYGRRRVGKTSTLLKFCENKSHIYLLADLKPEKEQMKDFSLQISEELNDELLKIQPLESFEALLTYIKRIASEKRIVIVLDEFPYLCKVNPAVSSILQKFWDLQLKKTKLFLILCGSSIGMMEKETLLQQSPLYGRRTGDWLFFPLKFKHFLKFFSENKMEQAISFFSIVGGIPEYILKINQKETVEKNILNIVKKGSPFYREVDFIIKEELTEPHNYLAILKAISFGKNKVNEIVNYTGLNKGMVSKYLSVLETLQFVSKKASITENIEKTRKSIYFICDNFLKFWFRFCFQYKSMIEEGKEEILSKNEILPNFPQFVSNTFEDICRELISNTFESGSWWSKEGEIDVVGFSKDKVLFGECKWSEEITSMETLQKLITTSQLVDVKKKEKIYALFSKKGFTKNLIEYSKTNKNIELYDLKRIERELRSKD